MYQLFFFKTVAFIGDGDAFRRVVLERKEKKAKTKKKTKTFFPNTNFTNETNVLSSHRFNFLRT